MKKTAVYPGTFDPITYGHIDVIQKSLKIVDQVIVAISDGENKKYLFTAIAAQGALPYIHKLFSFLDL